MHNTHLGKPVVSAAGVSPQRQGSHVVGIKPRTVGTGGARVARGWCTNPAATGTAGCCTLRLGSPRRPAHGLHFLNDSCACRPAGIV